MGSASVKHLWMVAVVLLLRANVADGQASIADEVSCRTCTIAVRDLVLLEDSPRSPIPGSPSAVVLDGQGRFWVLFNNDLPLVYGGDGSLIRELGPRGQGPDEYQYPVAVLPLPGDSTLVFDRSRQVVTVLDSNLRRARQIRLDQRVGGLAMMELNWPREVLVSSSQPIARGATEPFVVVSLEEAALSVVRQFGGLAARRPLASGADGSFWSWSSSTGYRLERWNVEGQRTGVIERAPSWWVRAPDRPTLEARPGSRVANVHEDEEGVAVGIHKHARTNLA